MNRWIFFLALLGICHFSCEENTNGTFGNQNSFPYDLSKPDKVYTLPEALNEISGISYLGQNRVACVQDEKGIIYIYNLSSEKIEDKIKFEDHGDFEDLAVAGDTYYIVRSDGKVFGLHGSRVEKFDIPLGPSCDMEGLCYNSRKNTLLLACKNGSKDIWEFDLREKRIADTPFLRVTMKGFHTAGLAIKNSTEELFILSGKRLMIASSKGEIKQIQAFNNPLFRQAEGITFKENNDLLISNEANGKEATILEFRNLQK